MAGTELITVDTFDEFLCDAGRVGSLCYLDANQHIVDVLEKMLENSDFTLRDKLAEFCKDRHTFILLSAYKCYDQPL